MVVTVLPPGATPKYRDSIFALGSRLYRLVRIYMGIALLATFLLEGSPIQDVGAVMSESHSLPCPSRISTQP